MEIIPVTSELSFELEQNRWRLVQNGASLTTLVEGDANRVQLDPLFSQNRRLSVDQIPVADIRHVVLGWRPERQIWQLGFVTSARFTPPWLELVTWRQNDPQIETLGSTLVGIIGQIMDKPANIVGEDNVPRPVISPQPAPPGIESKAPSVPLLPLPIEMGDWVLRNIGGGVALQPTGEWKTRRTIRSLFYLAGAIIFLLLGIGSLRSGLAPVNPEWLPYVAFGLCALLVFTSIETLWVLLTRQQIVLDEQDQEMRCERAMTKFIDWRVPYAEVDYLLVSQEPARSQGRREASDPMQIAQDTWVHVFTGEAFYLLAEVEDATGKSWQWDTIRQRQAPSARFPLDLQEYDTPLHHSVMELAQRLGVSVYVDIR